MSAPVLTRDPDALPEELPRGSEIPETLDPLADGILMAHQRSWLEDESDLKVCEKGRRTGITFAEMLGCALIAAAKRSAGGQNCFYIGDTKDKGREAIGYVAHFARVIAGAAHPIEEFLFEDQQPDGTTKFISAYRVRFASGFRVEALSSNPANIRGLQGTVVIDEAAFHKDVREVIDAVNAMLIWGGKVRIISTHNGYLNAFNELVREARSGKNGFKVHRYTFGDAVANGLYQRVCMMQGKTWTPEAEEAWEANIRTSYGAREAAMRQELDAEPAEMQGAALTRVQIEACQVQGIPFLRWTQPDSFKNADETVRKAAAVAWCEEHVKPVIESLDPERMHFMGEDFARSGDATDIVILEQGVDLVRRTKMIVELRNIPFDQQRDVLFWILDRIPRFMKGAMDRTGNGAYLAEVAAQRYGARIVEVAFSRQWYELEMPPYIEAFSDRTIVLPAHEDVLRDHQALQYTNGIIRVPENFRFKGSDGLDRHGDSAIAGALGWYATRQEVEEYGYRGVPRERSEDTRGGLRQRPDHSDDDRPRRGWWQPPMGARIRGGL
jgi:phage FluMu gp28-like protein